MARDESLEKMTVLYPKFDFLHARRDSSRSRKSTLFVRRRATRRRLNLSYVVSSSAGLCNDSPFSRKESNSRDRNATKPKRREFEGKTALKRTIREPRLSCTGMSPAKRCRAYMNRTSDFNDHSFSFTQCPSSLLLSILLHPQYSLPPTLVPCLPTLNSFPLQNLFTSPLQFPLDLILTRSSSPTLTPHLLSDSLPSSFFDLPRKVRRRQGSDSIQEIDRRE